MSSVFIQSVGRAFSILEYIAQNDGAGVTEVSQYLGLNKSTAFGLIKTMESLGYLYKNEDTNKYEVSLKLYTLTSTDANNRAITKVARPYLEELSKKYDETIHLVASDSNSVVYIDKLESSKPIRVYTSIGDSQPLYNTAVGKTILSSRSTERIQAYIDSVELEKFTKNTIVDKNELYEELIRVKERGYAVDDEENQEELYCMAVGIENIHNEAKYAISVSMPKFRVTEEIKKEIVTDLKDISRKLGLNFS